MIRRQFLVFGGLATFAFGVILGIDLLGSDSEGGIDSVPLPTVLGATLSRSSVTTVPVPPRSTTVPPATTSLAVDSMVSTGEFSYAEADDGTVFGRAPFLEFSVATEVGVGIEPAGLAAFVDATLSDPRSWIGDGVTGLRRVAEGGTFVIVVATPGTVDERCLPLRTNGIFSCATNGFVMLNVRRWLGATDDWPADLETYRRYLVNHEVGHFLRGPTHDVCPGDNALAPVMMQQTKGLDGCVANGWVFPDP